MQIFDKNICWSDSLNLVSYSAIFNQTSSCYPGHLLNWWLLRCKINMLTEMWVENMDRGLIVYIGIASSLPTSCPGIGSFFFVLWYIEIYVEEHRTETVLCSTHSPRGTLCVLIAALGITISCHIYSAFIVTFCLNYILKHKPKSQICHFEWISCSGHDMLARKDWCCY